MNRTLSLIIAMLFLLLMSACSEQQPEVQTEEKHPVSNEEKVIIPESVEGKWKSVKIALHDQQEGTENIYRVDIGGSFQISGSNLRVTIENFIPAFSVNNERTTSVSNKPTNPAVLIIVRDGEQEIHRGWVFALYPERHKFENPRYKFVLLDYKAKG